MDSKNLIHNRANNRVHKGNKKRQRIYNNHINGLLLVDKEKTWTSFDAVAKVRNMLNVKKVGHTGTLDPMATGLLVLCVGKATKLAERLTGLDKEYVGEVTFGTTSTTDDAEGELSKMEDAEPVTLEQIRDTLKVFEGEIEQMPPQFSAKKVGGKRAYKLARKGEKVELEAKKIRINEIEILDYEWPKLTLRIDCGKGTYIRAIARDLGEKLGIGGYLTALERTKVGQFNLQHAKKVGEIMEQDVIPMAMGY